MEKKNTVLLTVIAVATLLVAVVGATFAYFTATTTADGNGGTAEVNTATVGDVTLTMAPVTTANTLEYPGGYLVVGASVTGTHTGTAAYNTTFTVEGTVDASNVTTDLTWKLYEVESTIATPVDKCQVKQTVNGTETQYTYENCTLATELTGDAIASGTATAGAVATVSVDNETLTTATTPGTVTYYYLVVAYPETGTNQDADQGAKISAALTRVTNGTAAQAQ